MITALLILHGLAAVGLLGAITHQALAAAARQDIRRRSFFARFRVTDGALYSNAVVVLFVLVGAMGAMLYPQYRITVRPMLQTMDLRAANGVFELKEHFSALALVLLPAYWATWRQSASDYATARKWLTWILAGLVWWNFVIGQLLAAIKGLVL
ncbi:MAG TPA: hypothetical protein VEU95_10645 [Micropepsaceae bacterium]|jgi:hypothetical protein|nr:hypothetical protein [Micropepsaceae bacterium]